jgi:superfamily II DNA or RNA helicase
MQFRRATPREVALRMLEATYGSAATDRARETSAFRLSSFQEDAVAIASAIIARRGGVIVADSVGLGKTFIALGLVEKALRIQQSVFVITPASLRRDWTRHLAALEEEAEASPRATARIRWLSHTRLSRMGASASLLRASVERRPLVVVDEAHAFRSSTTRRYRALSTLCRNSDVVLVTATPVNNSLLDLYNLIRLFASDAALHDVGIPHLGEVFRENGLATRDLSFLKTVVSSLVVRRTRAFVKQNYDSQGASRGLRFPAAAPPIPVSYSLAACEDHSRALLGLIRSLRLAPYRVLSPVSQSAKGFAAELVRFHLLKRLESSAAAFHATTVRLLAFYYDFTANLAAGRMAPLRGTQAAAGDPLQLSLDSILTVPVPKSVDVQAVLAACYADAKSLVAAEALSRRIVANDPKLAQMMELLSGRLHGRKVLIFAEYRETARYLWRNLVLGGRVGHIDGDESHLGQTRAPRRMVVERFAPHSNHARAPLVHEKVDILVATDVLSEGINLQDASAVISYDLPWNPVRLIQRVGRIDRLGSMHEWVASYHFVPDDMLDEMLGLMKKLRRKVTAIRTSVGAESSVLGPDPTDVITDVRRGDAGAFQRAEASSLDNTAEERLRTLYFQLARHHAPNAGNNDDCIVCEVCNPEISCDRWLLVYVRGDTARRVVVENGIVRPAGEDAARRLEQLLSDDRNAAPVASSSSFQAISDTVHRYAEKDTPCLGQGDCATRLIRRVTGLAARLPGGPTDDQCARIDAARRLILGWPEASAQAVLSEISRLAEQLPPAERLDEALQRIEAGMREPPMASGAPVPLRIVAIIGELVTNPRTDIAGLRG